MKKRVLISGLLFLITTIVIFVSLISKQGSNVMYTIKYEEAGNTKLYRAEPIDDGNNINIKNVVYSDVSDNFIQGIKVGNDTIVLHTIEENPDIKLFIDSYYESVEKNSKQIYGEDYVLDKTTLAPPLIETNCEYRSKLTIVDLKSDNNNHDVTLPLNAIPSEYALSMRVSDNKVFIAVITCIQFGNKESAEGALSILEYNVSNDKVNIIKQNVLSEVDRLALYREEDEEEDKIIFIARVKGVTWKAIEVGPHGDISVSELTNSNMINLEQKDFMTDANGSLYIEVR